jgi:hypothetical protein
MVGFVVERMGELIRDRFMEIMHIPLAALVKPFWPADKQDALLAELNEVMLKEVVSMAGGEDKHLEMECEAVLGWGVKA